MAKKILVIDDSALMRRVISDIINESNEYEVAAIAKDGLEGLDMIVSNPYEYSAVILDINMPKLNGLELLQRLQKDHIEQTVIVVSTVAREGAKETIQALEYEHLILSLSLRIILRLRALNSRIEYSRCSMLQLIPRHL